MITDSPAGDYRYRVTIQRPVRTDSVKSGERKVGYEDVRTVWAAIRPLSSREQTDYAQTQMLATHEVKVRFTTDITGECRLVNRGKVYNIVGPPLNDPEAELRMTVSEKA